MGDLIFIQTPIWSEESTSEISVTAEVSETENISIEDKLEQVIDLDYKDADLCNILRSLSWTYDVNIIASPDVKGKVTVNLKNITVGKALEAMLTINGLAYTIRDGIMYVSKGDTKVVNLTSEVIRLKYIQSGEAQNILKKVISEKGDIKIDELSNALIITDFTRNIQKVIKLLKKIDIAPQQVLIEAKIVDITSTDLAMFGIKWDADFNPGHGIFTRKQKAYEERLKGTLDMSEQSSSLTGGQFTLDTLALLDLTITGTLDALVKDGKANLLASPTIAVLNNQEARIVIGERYPYKERTQTATGTTETTKFVDIGVTLRVVPQINEDGYITMRVHPEVSSLYASLDAGPRITTREADTTVRIKEGETLIIAGLIKQGDEFTKEKIPILGDIPVLGLLFSRSERNKERKELAVFITPKILLSRQEKKTLSRKQIEQEGVLVHIERTGQLTIVEQIFKSARDLDKGWGLESRRKDKGFRKNQALSFYEHIYVEFPDSYRAPEALYRASLIYYKYCRDNKRTKECLSRLISDYPDSPFCLRAKKLYKKVEKYSKQRALINKSGTNNITH
ncbi:MAG: secretin and TonB N-terminal domain-containing protein [Candidatus Omnitrophica bacterium]|nr:secretin and TonB N-terminal domain-containing protein [Candidatus Omnitrophota bacterium]